MTRVAARQYAARSRAAVADHEPEAASPRWVRPARAPAPAVPGAMTGRVGGRWSIGGVALGPPSARQPLLGAPTDAAEHEADRMAAGALGGRTLGGQALGVGALDVQALGGRALGVQALGVPGGEQRTVGSGQAPGRIGPTAGDGIEAVAREPGRPLPADIGGRFGQRFGFDFGSVRIHDGAQADRTARAIGADAYSLGPHLAFARGSYEPGSVRGQALLAHELAHVVQHARTGGPPVIRRSLAGTLIGGGIGAAVGGVALGLLGSLLGPAGAVAGAILGGLGGAALGGWLGDKASTDSRGLTQPEKDAATTIFHTSVDLGAVEIRRGSLLSGGNTARTSGNLINLPDAYFVGKTMQLTPAGSLVLIHELVHVWQYQHGGFSYIELSLVPQAVAGSRGISRNAAYNWRNSEESGIPWERWNAEEQAECISDYNEAVQRMNADQYDSDPTHDRLKDFETITRAEPYLLKLQAGVGAPGSKAAPAGR